MGLALKGLKKIEEIQRCIVSSINYGVARNRISLWNHDITVRNAVETHAFQFISASDKKILSTVEISKFILKANKQISITDFLRK